MPESSEKTALCTNSSFLDWFSANQHGKDKKLVLQQQGHIFRLIGCNEAAFLFLRALDLSFFPLPFFFTSSVVAHFIVFLLHGIVAGQTFRKETNSICK